MSKQQLSDPLIDTLEWKAAANIVGRWLEKLTAKGIEGVYVQDIGQLIYNVAQELRVMTEEMARFKLRLMSTSCLCGCPTGRVGQAISAHIPDCDVRLNAELAQGKDSEHCFPVPMASTEEMAKYFPGLLPNSMRVVP